MSHRGPGTSQQLDAPSTLPYPGTFSSLPSSLHKKKTKAPLFEQICTLCSILWLKL